MDLVGAQPEASGRRIRPDIQEGFQHGDGLVRSSPLFPFTEMGDSGFLVYFLTLVAAVSFVTQGSATPCQVPTIPEPLVQKEL